MQKPEYNPLLATDVYKLGHMTQYPANTEYIFSYMEARREDVPVVFFGLQAIINRYLNYGVTQYECDQMRQIFIDVLSPSAKEISTFDKKLEGLYNLGFIPLAFVAPKEGTITRSKNAILGITNTLPGFGWVVGYFETLLLKLWNTCTVATYSAAYRALVEKYLQETCYDGHPSEFLVHDFGSRGVSSEETAAVSGAAHLLSFTGTDNIQAVAYLKDYYDSKPEHYNSISASEHSVMASYGPKAEHIALGKLLETEGPVSIVADTYDYFNWLTTVLPQYKDKIMARKYKTVIRPDSGVPKDIILKTLPILAELFGFSTNTKGYKELHPAIGIIYGDGMHYDTFAEVLEAMKQAGWATNNLVIGVGGLLLQNHSRDDFGFSLKAAALTSKSHLGKIKTEPLQKDPATDPTKKSKAGVCIYREAFSSPYTNSGTIILPDIYEDQTTHELMHDLYKANPNMLNYIQLVDIRHKQDQWEEDWSTIKQRFELYFSLPEVKTALLNLRKKQYTPDPADRKCV